MGWEDALFRWVDGMIAAHPALDHWLELHAHEWGLHGPYLRHLLRSRLLSVVLVLVGLPLSFVVGVQIHRVQELLGRSRRGGGRGAARPSPRSSVR